MAGQQHHFLSGFPNVQQSAMRTQFGGGQMVSGLMGPQQGSEYLNYLCVSSYLQCLYICTYYVLIMYILSILCIICK